MTIRALVRFALGLVTLIFAVGLSTVVLSSAAVHLIVRLPAWASVLFASMAAFFFLATAYLWFQTIRMTAGDDVLSGERGLLLSLMLVSAIAIAGLGALIVVQPEFWKGAAAGARDARR